MNKEILQIILHSERFYIGFQFILELAKRMLPHQQ